MHRRTDAFEMDGFCGPYIVALRGSVRVHSFFVHHIYFELKFYRNADLKVLSRFVCNEYVSNKQMFILRVGTFQINLQLSTNTNIYNL